MRKKYVAGILVLCLATIVSIAFCFYAKDTVNNNITSQKEIIITVIKPIIASFLRLIAFPPFIFYNKP